MIPSTLCLLRLSAIGDVCHAVAMVERIQRTAPQTRITWIIGKIEYQLVKHLPDIEFVIFDKKQGKAAYQTLKQQLKGKTFDALFVMQVAFRANLAARVIKARHKYGFDWRRSKELHWLFANRRIAAQTHGHVLEGFMGFADAAGFPDGGELKWHLPIEESNRAWADQQLAALGRFAVISPAASKAERNWLPERYAAAAEHLASRGIAPVLCGGPAQIDRELGEQIQAHTDKIALNLIGKTDLNQLLAVLSRAILVLAPDTGPAHMATMVSTPVVGLYAHSNPRRTGPYLSQRWVVSVYDEVIKQQKGKAWEALPWGARAKGKALMQRISTDAVTARIDALLTELDQ